MALHGLGSMTLGVPDVDDARQFYREFGLTELAPGIVRDPRRRRATAGRRAPRPPVGRGDAGGRRPRRRRPHRVPPRAHDLDVTHRPRRRQHLGASSRSSASASRVAVRDRITQPAYDTPPMNGPGNTVARRRPGAGDLRRGRGRAPPARSRAVGHARHRGQQAVPRRRARVQVQRRVGRHHRLPALLTDHHNVGLISSPVPFFHHSSWQVDDLDEIGHGAHHLLAADPTCNVWGLGRHFLGSNLFWYFRDPAGNFAEYFADLDQIRDDDEWMPATGRPTSRCTRGVRRSHATSSNHPTSPRSRRR